LFEAEEDQPIGRQLVLKIHMTGWRLAGEDIVEAGSDSEALITAIAEVRRCDYNPATHRYAVGVQFLGRVLS
jgi:hypothetical protein